MTVIAIERGMQQSPAGKDVSMEAEEYPLFITAVWQQLLKHRSLNFTATVIFRVWSSMRCYNYKLQMFNACCYQFKHHVLSLAHDNTVTHCSLFR